jgi:GNAT superfamily N-acetyltransferase/predicted nucleic acid-binding protein
VNGVREERRVTISVKWRSRDVAQFVDLVTKRADQEREALGFLPRRVYQQAAAQEKLLVAIGSEDGAEAYAGHLIFGGVFPSARIFQLFVEPRFRRQGVGRRLVQALIRKTQVAYYLSLTAKVANDLEDANAFWERMQFSLVRTTAGGISRGRSINIRVRILETPNLISLIKSPAPRKEADLQLVERLSTRAPLYVLDLNVLFDVVRRRARATQAALVIGAGLANAIRLAVTEELIEELQRSSGQSESDPILELAMQLRPLPRPASEELDKICSALAAVVFPDKAVKGSLSVQDHSDIMHLAAAIHHRADGFVTSEKAILEARNRLQINYGIDVIGVGELAETVEPRRKQSLSDVRAELGGYEICSVEVNDHQREIADQFLDDMFVPPQLRIDALSAGSLGAERRRVLVISNQEQLAFASWDVPSGPQSVVKIFICVDEYHTSAETLAHHLLDRICSEVSGRSPALVHLRELPGHSITRRVAIAQGFRPTNRQIGTGASLQKVCVGRPVDKTNWGTVRLQIQGLTGVKLPRQMPELDHSQHTVRVENPSGTIGRLTVQDLESLLSPVLFLFPQRSGVIVPIRRVFADPLFGASSQLSFLASPEAFLLRERVYFSHPRTKSILVEGAPLLFYESGRGRGKSSIIAAARIVRSSLIFKTEISPSVQRRGVVEKDTLSRLSKSERAVATTFDNIMIFKNPVSIQRLREIGCVDRTNLVTAQHVSHRCLARILSEGEPNG